MEKIKNLMKFLWPIHGSCTKQRLGYGHSRNAIRGMMAVCVCILSLTLSVSVLLSGCYDELEMFDGTPESEKYAPDIVKRTKAMLENKPDFSLPDMEKHVVDFQKKIKSQSVGLEVDWDDFHL